MKLKCLKVVNLKEVWVFTWIERWIPTGQGLFLVNGLSSSCSSAGKKHESECECVSSRPRWTKKENQHQKKTW